MNSKSDFSYYNVVDQIYNSQWTGKKFVHMQLFDEILKKLWPKGHPTQFFHVAGTSGKGSVCIYLEAGLGLSAVTGSYTNPHMFDYRERFSIQGKLVSRKKIVRVWEKYILPLHIFHLRRYPQFPLKFSELSLLIALKLFELHKVKYASIETGVGGRYHCSNVLPVKATAIVTVSEDHEDMLGQTQWQRALEKGGIMRKAVPCFSSVREPEAKFVLEKIAVDFGAPLFFTKKSILEKVNHFSNTHKKQTQLIPKHQQENTALALQMIQYFFPKLSVEKILAAICTVTLPGRMQQIEKNLYIDGAHNREKITRLAEDLKVRFPNEKFVFLLGLSGDRNPQRVFESLLSISHTIVITDEFHKAVASQMIFEALRKENNNGFSIEVIHNPKSAFVKAKKLQGNRRLIVTGSLYLLDALLNPDPYLQHLNIVSNWRENE
ncbi:MAG: hypothetical protein A3B74_01710 [Candidatus Kerfeldbacteria bacterium RIFCSPHIGHO2_02_FULL_42_14]|uniref:tetrahydrofolate synthase n=1 Tax=Candidatus Kerfeldbacteria bacterium RIFCSPHIGHO2_02_FULL_42_14 TaxID=1798540 RepID=A0A1G2AS46_9BACT|nr:MAG: hypothetical protein A3B74_01710 [Candidatus Kerfeldbacteria bacterium RIFCSPHIGHO2_02_FULL_42_14]OGY82229.1 MAG: hypothetical protein A3E60_00040 [Candidatus Kerfeldbacteria bacterium RIFCSPHIGHO2_12_FULL_42_13]OGY82704.1 MAG: hypothetical protein A3I91_00930 [Candidatus Kerfeldbacteria bacterium RIFCSPLOWO2_02_FULL_42_19]OGY87802.1 MAG: hypothetical protein A3G01_05135 [Candidatus Kerfeldbacteria bacterium RIFCSPLOWO2_12_FULL_43_9]